MYVKGKKIILRNGYFVTHGYVFICDSKSPTVYYFYA